MKKILSFVGIIALIVSSLFSVSLIANAETLGDDWTAKQSIFTGSLWNDTFAWRDLSEVNFNTLGTNLITDPTVGNFDGEEYPEYYSWTTKDTSKPVNPDAWWDRPALAYNGFTMDPVTNKYTSARYSGYILNDASLSHTNDGSGVLKIAETRKSAYLPLASVEKYSYYAITFWMKASDANYDGDVKLYSAPEGTELLSINQARLVQLKGNNQWIQFVALIYTGNKAWSQPAITIPGSKSTTYYFDDFGMYKLDEEYGASCIEAGYLLPNIVPEEVPSDEWSAIQSMYTGSIWNDTFAWRDLSNVYFDSFGKNLITDPTVSNFVNGEYPEYYDWESRDAGTVLNGNAWWDKPAIVYNGFEMDVVQNRYTSARYSGYVLNDDTLSHTADGSGVIKIGDTRKSLFLPLPRMEKYSYYAITFWMKAGDAIFEGDIVISDKADGTALLEINQARLVQIKGNNKWVQYAAVIYTGNNAWGQPAIKLPGSKSTTYYFDDFGMYELDNTYGTACVEAGYLLDSEDYVKSLEKYGSTATGMCLSMRDKKYISGYENINWSDYGKNVWADTDVSRFDQNGNYLDYDTAPKKLAILDKPVSDANTETIYKSIADRGFVTADTNYSHTDDSSGAIYIPVSSSGAARTVYIGLPLLERYAFYAVSFWLQNPENDFAQVRLRRVGSETNFADAIFDAGYDLTGENNNWQRVTFLIFTGKLSDYSLEKCYIEIAGIKNACIDDIEVVKLDDEDFANECRTAGKLIIENDIDGSVSVDAGDIAYLMKELLCSIANSKEVFDINKDGAIDVRDLVKFKNIIAGVEDFYKYCNNEMLNASVLYTGDTQRLSYKIKEALANKNKNTTIAVLGDSITYGAGATNDARHYSTKFKNWWRDTISESVSLVRRGSGATTSYLGVHWADEAILPHNPDIIFIEYVNDTNDNGTLQAMDSLVRRCLELESKPAVVLLEMSYYGTKGEGVLSNAQETHIQVAKAYGVPVISWRDAVEVALNNGMYKWTDLSADEVHPNNTGNAMLAEMMVYFTSKYIANSTEAQEPDVFDTPAITVDKYKNATIKAKGEVTVIDEGNFTETVSFAGEKYNVFEDGWATTTGGSITFKMTFKNLGMVCQRTSDDLNGKVEIKVDGNKVITIDGDNAAGWGTFNHAQEIITFDEEAEHTVTVTVVENDTRKAFQIVGWLVS